LILQNSTYLHVCCVQLKKLQGRLFPNCAVHLEKVVLLNTRIFLLTSSWALSLLLSNNKLFRRKDLDCETMIALCDDGNDTLGGLAQPVEITTTQVFVVC